MSIRTNHFDPLIVTLTVFFVIATVAYGFESRKLDGGSVPGDQGIKCTPKSSTTEKAAKPKLSAATWSPILYLHNWSTREPLPCGANLWCCKPEI
ncbi:hypothetical protein GQ457_03G009960 [Hibiscus cannabinus]